MFFVTVEQTATAGDRTNHVAYVQLNDHLIEMKTRPTPLTGASSGTNCPLPTDPRRYPFSKTLPLPGIPSVNETRPPKYVQDDAEFGALQASLAATGLTLAKAPAQVGDSLIVSGLLKDLPQRGLALSLYYCRCTLNAPQPTDLDFPHPVIVTVTQFRSNSTTTTEHVGYFHEKQPDAELSGLLYEDDQFSEPKRPYRRFDLRLRSDGKIDSANYVNRPHGAAASS
jgi:hypothetical protein